MHVWKTDAMDATPMANDIGSMMSKTMKLLRDNSVGCNFHRLLFKSQGRARLEQSVANPLLKPWNFLMQAV